MSFQDILMKALNKYPKTSKMLQVSFHESIPGKQIQLDTMFWRIIDTDKHIPILVIVDVATRYTRFFIQKRRNDSVREHVETFIDELKEKFELQNVAVSPTIKIVADGAKEFLTIGRMGSYKGHTIEYEVSQNMNKAVIAENVIRRVRYYLKKIELRYVADSLKFKKLRLRIDRRSLPELLKKYEDEVNKDAAVREKPKRKSFMKKEYYLGQPVFLMNLDKYYPHQVKMAVRKTSYDLPWYMEPFYISKIYSSQGIFKYGISSYDKNEPVKYMFYTEQLQPVPPQIAHKYVEAWLGRVKPRKR